MTKDMSAPNWARSYPRLMRNVIELRELGAQIVLPPDFDKPPNQRAVRPGPANGPAVMIGEHGPELLLDRPHHPLL